MELLWFCLAGLVAAAAASADVPLVPSRFAFLTRNKEKMGWRMSDLTDFRLRGNTFRSMWLPSLQSIDLDWYKIRYGLESRKPPLEVGDMARMIIRIRSTDWPESFRTAVTRVRISQEPTMTANPFFRPEDAAPYSANRPVPGVFCEGAPNVTVPEPFSHEFPRVPPPGRYGPQGTSPTEVCRLICQTGTNATCSGKRLRSATKRCDCAKEGFVKRPTPYYAGRHRSLDWLVDAKLRPRQHTQYYEWHVRSESPARIMGSDSRGMSVVTYLPSEFDGLVVQWILSARLPGDPQVHQHYMSGRAEIVKF